jgi:short-chain fatty acids transporter
MIELAGAASSLKMRKSLPGIFIAPIIGAALRFISSGCASKDAMKPAIIEEEKEQASEQKGWMTRFSHLMGRLVPDAITTSIFMLVALFIVALAIGNTLTATMDAYYRGLWMLLPFTMQMTLILALSSVLGDTSLFRKTILALSRKPRTSTGVLIYSVLISAILSYFYWGLGLALGPLICVHFASEAERKGIKMDFPFLMAVTGAANSVWQYGLSASAPLMMATPNHFLEDTTGLLSLKSTLFAPATIIHVIGFTVALIIAARLLLPKKPQSLSQFPEARKIADSGGESAIKKTDVEPNNAERDNIEPNHAEMNNAEINNGPRNYSERMERNHLLPIVLCAALAGWLYYHFAVKGLGLDLNSLNTILLLLCFLLHRNIQSFSKALQKAIVSCWPVVVIYHLYAGVAGLIQFTTVGAAFAGLFAAISTRYTFPLVTALAGTLVAIFVPSSGGQWVIQGFVTSKAAEAVGVTAQRGMLALGIGDQMGNLVSPFWYVVRSEIARMDFRTYFGYGLIFAALWFVIGVAIFTFLPC